MKPSVCIIGAGMGGLTAGAFLAKNGFDVTILEKATSVGGSAGFYTRKDRRFSNWSYRCIWTGGRWCA